MRIGELTKKYNVSCRQIRHYEELGLLTSGREDSSNYRIYDQNACDRLEIIRLLRDLNFSLKEIKQALDFPIDDKTRRLFAKKSIELEQDAHAFSNRAQILRTVARILTERGASTLSLAEIVKECSYVHSKNERMIPVENIRIVVAIGHGLIPLIDGENSPISHGIQEIRRNLKDELNFELPLIQVRDDIAYKDLTLTVSIDGKRIGTKTYTSIQTEETAADILSFIKTSIKDNLTLLA